MLFRPCPKYRRPLLKLIMRADGNANDIYRFTLNLIFCEKDADVFVKHLKALEDVRSKYHDDIRDLLKKVK